MNLSTQLFDNLPCLSKKEACEILSTPPAELDLISDYYKAAYHLSKYPGIDSENILLNILKSKDPSEPYVLARRKAVESLVKLRCLRAIPFIGNCLYSHDIYLVEIAAWALKELKCNDSQIHKKMISLLDDPRQNRRIIIQSLSELRVTDTLNWIHKFLGSSSDDKGLRGASISALFTFTGENILFDELESNLLLVNQNDRHCAVQDMIHSGSFEFIPALLRAAISPYFRLKAIDALWPYKEEYCMGMGILETLDKSIIDEISNLNILHKYDFSPNESFLVEELFSTDFSRAYLALQTLLKRDSIEIWGYVEENLERGRRDYGALYFLVLLFMKISDWEIESIEVIISFLVSALDSQWPQFMKFRPVAIKALANFSNDQFLLRLPLWLDKEKTPYWACRYAALSSIEDLIISYNNKNFYMNFRDKLVVNTKDSNWFVAYKAESVLEKYFR